MQSMTGFGSADWAMGGTTFTCEMRSVNNRFLEINSRLPKLLMALETEVTSTIKASLQRGKVDVFFDIKTATGSEKGPKANLEFCAQYFVILKDLQALAVKEGVADLFERSTLVDILRLDGALEASGGGEDRETFLSQNRAGLLKALGLALESLEKSRVREGAGLKAVLNDLMQEVLTLQAGLVSKIQPLRGSQFDAYKKRLENVMQSLGEERAIQALKALPEERVLAELTILVDKSDVEEELQRLGIHTKEFLNCMNGKGPHGKKLDFLCQEMHREVNTISSKLLAIEASSTIMAMKQAVERIRQQIQNVE